MSEKNSSEQERLITETADWYARMRSSSVSEIDAVRFRAWLAADGERRREFETLDALWDDLGAIENSPEVIRARAGQFAKSGVPRARLRHWPWALAATMLVAMSTAVLIWRLGGTERYATDVGEQRTVPLADGSIVTLNTATRIAVHYSDSKRRIDLLSGQANFEVAQDAARPFVVAAGGGEVRALGTIFDVYKSVEKVTVTLIEGKVAVTGEGNEISLAPGEQISYSNAAPLVKSEHTDLRRVTAWRARKLDFSDTPILEAIAEANRYSREQIVFEAPDLATARLSGTFEAGKSDLFVEGLQAYFRLKVYRTEDHRIILTAPHD